MLFIPRNSGCIEPFFLKLGLVGFAGQKIRVPILNKISHVKRTLTLFASG